MYNSRLCHILGRRDLIASARFLPLSKLKLHHILPSVMNRRMKESAQLIVVKISSVESVTLKDCTAPLENKEA